MQYIWSIYIRNFGLVHCASEDEALAIRAEYLKRNPRGEVAMPQKLELATVEGFFAG